MSMFNMDFKTDQMFGILLLFFLTSKTGGVQITSNVSTQDNSWVNSWYTPDIMNYTIDINRYNLDLSEITSLVFKIKSCDFAYYVLLSNSNVRDSSKPFYGIFITNKTNSHIFYRADASRYTINFVNNPSILSCTVFYPYWISWANGDIKVGSGVVVGEHDFGNLTNTHHFDVRGIGVITDNGFLGNWTILLEVSDKFTGYFDSCSMDNIKSDMDVIDDITCSDMRCATSCGISKICMGYNFNSVMHRCELLSFGSDVVTDIPHHIEDGWKFYSKCYNGKTACLGCYF